LVLLPLSGNLIGASAKGCEHAPVNVKKKQIMAEKMKRNYNKGLRHTCSIQIGKTEWRINWNAFLRTQ
jgi:hypothetical protein